MTKIIEKHNTIFAFSGIVMNLILVFQCLVLWISPDINEADKIITFTVVIAFEFFMIPLAILLVMLPKKASIYILFPFFGLFALAMNARTNSNIILVIYTMAIFNRMRFAFSNPSEEMKSDAIGKLFLSLFAYFILAPLITLIFSIPRFGLTKEFLNASGYFKQLIINSGGLFVNEPMYALFFGVIYYILLTIIEYLFIRRQVDN